MNRQHLEWYLTAIRHEIEAINEHEFVGNVDFKLNINKGTIANMNVTLAKSLKMFEQV